MELNDNTYILNDDQHRKLSCFSLEIYSEIKAIVISHGFEDEIKWQDSLSVDDISESQFLKEAAWVVLSSGFRESVVRKKFKYISLCFCNWESAKEITENCEQCFDCAMESFSNKRKMNAIVKIAKDIHFSGFEYFWSKVLLDPIAELKKLPYVGDITSFHLAKNLGFNVAKADRHLARIADSFGFENDANSFCLEVSKVSNDKVNVIDLVLWRFATIESSYLDFLQKRLNELETMSFDLINQTHAPG
ncbi:MAG: hypothetical protein HN353_13050 [Bdellovibrionales bacterium]|jgi:hypothetical protein|nr:hypothetical protein [Bdellovibrionales bacterium]MBT3525928.1 hypothetical protein [Bdellovibrionales bacterium]